MNREKTVNNKPFAESGKKNWYLSVKSPSPKQTLTVKFEDGKQYKYLGAGQVNIGDPVVIGYGGATSYMMGNVVGAENGITIKRTHALKPLFTFSTDPGKVEIKKNADGMKKLGGIDEVSEYFGTGPSASNEEKFQVIDYLTLGVLNAITVVAYPELSTPGTVNEAKAFLAEEIPVPGIVFGKEFTKTYYGVWFDTLRYAECAEVALTGHYPGWDKDLLACKFWNSPEYAALDIDADWNDDNTAYYLYFEDGTKKMERYFASCEEFRTITNELVMRSALSILIRGGFTNLLKAALSVEMPIKSFYQKLIAFADEIGSKECSKVLKSVDYESKVFEKAAKSSTEKKKATVDKRFQIKDAVLVEYKGNDETVAVPDGVKIIGEFAFSENKAIKKVILPDSVTQMKKCAFSFCEGLQEIVLGKNTSSLGNSCFYHCKALAAVDFSNTKVKTLAKELFSGCQSLKSMDLSQTKITAIKEDVFRNSGLEKISLSPKLESIGDSAFAGTKVTELVIPASVKEISSYAFLGLLKGNSALRRIVFEGSDALSFRADSVDRDCVIVCTRGSALLAMLEKQNAGLVEQSKKFPTLGDAPRKIEER